MKSLKAWVIISDTGWMYLSSISIDKGATRTHLKELSHEGFIHEVIIRTVEDSEARDKYSAELMYDCGRIDKEIGLGDIWEKHFQVFLDEEYQEK